MYPMDPMDPVEGKGKGKKGGEEEVPGATPEGSKNWNSPVS